MILQEGYSVNQGRHARSLVVLRTTCGSTAGQTLLSMRRSAT